MAMAEMTLDQASEALRGALRDAVRKNSVLFLVQGVLLVVAGIIAVLMPIFRSEILAALLGWVLIGTCGVQLLVLLGAAKIPHFWPQAISAGLAGIIGVLITIVPAARGALVLLLTVFFMVEGIAKIVFALSVRPLAAWMFVLLSGLLGVLISLYLLADQQPGVVFLGLLVGIQLIGEGCAVGLMALRARLPR